jgi:hypothetical protein
MATLADFRTRYPAFAAVADATVTYWLGEGDDAVVAWRAADQDKGAMAYAAHKLAEQGLDGSMVGGVTSFKSGTFSAAVSDAAARRTGLHSTIYGREFIQLARRTFAGPRTAVIPAVGGL